MGFARRARVGTCNGTDLSVNSPSYMSNELNLGWGGPIRDDIGFWGGAIKGYATNLVQGSHGAEISCCGDEIGGSSHESKHLLLNTSVRV